MSLLIEYYFSFQLINKPSKKRIIKVSQLPNMIDSISVEISLISFTE